MALDRKAISEKLFAGSQPVADSPRQPARLGLRPTACRTTPTIRQGGRARCSTRPAGATCGSGVRHNGQGEPLSLELTTTAGNRMRELVEQVIQSQWKQARHRHPHQGNEPRARLLRRDGEPAAVHRPWRCSPGSARPRTCRGPRSTPSRSRRPPTAGPGRTIRATGTRRWTSSIDAIERELDRDKRQALCADLQRDPCRRPARAAAVLPRPSRTSGRSGSRAWCRPGTWTPARSGSSTGAPRRAESGPAQRTAHAGPAPVLRYLIHRLLEAAAVLLLCRS